jgi:hypothetical protein
MSNDQPAPRADDNVPAVALDAAGETVAPVVLDPSADPSSWAPVEAPGPRCPWCSAALPEATLEHCPSCRAQLSGSVDSGVPGLTEVQPAQKAAPLESVKRNRLLAWISGEVLDDQIVPSNTPAGAEAIAPPSRDVKREILRLQLEAAGIQVPVASPSDATAPTPEPAADAAAAAGTDRESTAA